MTNACWVNRNESMFSRADWGISFFAQNSHNATDPNKFNQVLRDMMKEIASRAANDGLVWSFLLNLSVISFLKILTTVISKKFSKFLNYTL